MGTEAKDTVERGEDKDKGTFQCPNGRIKGGRKTWDVEGTEGGGIGNGVHRGTYIHTYIPGWG